jgi:hypothetical protein
MTDEEAERLADLLWQARIARDRLNAANCTPEDRAEALRVWDEVRREVESASRGKLDYLESLASQHGLPPLKFCLREIEPELIPIRLARFRKTGETKEAKKGRGRPERSFGEIFDIASEVNVLRAHGEKFEWARDQVARRLGKSVGSIHETYRQYKRRMKALRKKGN